MTNERIMILEMVKDGKISVDDGVKLLNAINKNSSTFDDFTNDIKYKIYNMPKPNTQKLKQNAQIFFDKTEEMFDDFTKSVKYFFTTNSPEQTNNNSTINVNPVEPKNNEDNETNINN